MRESMASAWLPNHTPTWGTVFVWLLVAVSLSIDLFVEPISWMWLWVVAGFVLTMIALGPASRTSIGHRIGDWFQESTMGERALFIVLSLVGIYGLGVTFDIPIGPATNFANGALLWILVYIPLQVLYAGGISGWSPDSL